MTESKLSDLFYLFLLVLALIFFFYPILFGNKMFVTTGVIMSDLLNQNYPFKFVYSQGLKEGRLPFWIAKMGDGFPLVAEGQVGAYYPLNLLLFYFLPPLLAFNFSLVLHFYLGGAFAYLLARTNLRLSYLASLITALSFSLCGFLIVHLIHVSLIQTAIWLPLELLLLEKILKRPRVWQAIPLGIVFAFQFLAGHAEIFYFSALFLAAYVGVRLFWGKKDKGFWQSFGPLLVLVIAAVITLVLCLPQLFSTWQFIGQSNRAKGFSFAETTSYIFPLKHLLTFIVPWMFDFAKESIPPIGTPEMTNLWETYLYIGLVPLSLALLAVIKGMKKNKNVQLYAILLTISLVLAFGRTTPIFKIFWSLVPGMKLFKYPTRFLLLSHFSLSLLAGLGLDYLLQLVKKIKIKSDFERIVGMTILIITFLDLFLIQRQVNPVGNASEWLSSPETAKFLQENLGDYRFYTLGTSNIDYLTIKNLEAQKGLRELLPGDFNLLYGLASTNDQSAIFLDRHTRLAKSTPGARLQFEEPNVLIVSDNLMKVLSLRGVKFVLSALPLQSPNLNLIKKYPLPEEVDYIIPQLEDEILQIKKVLTQTVYIYENSQVIPRAWVVYRVKDLSGSKENTILETIISEDYDPRSEVILEEKYSYNLSGVGEGKAEIVSYQDEEVEIQVSSTADGFLVFSDNFYPTWKAYVDGEETKIFLANFTFRAVPISSGEHKVEFIFKPF